MRTRSCQFVRATLVACGTVGLLASLATAQQLERPKSPEQQKKAANASKEPAKKVAQPSLTGTSTGIKAAANSGHQAGGGVIVVRGPGMAADDCALAPVVGEGSFGYDTNGFTGVDPDNCAFQNQFDGWWAYQPTSSGTASVTTCGNTGDTTLSAFDVCGGTQLACNDDACDLLSTITFPVTAGNTYMVRIAGYNLSFITGTATIAVTGASPNEACGAAVPEVLLNTPLAGSTLGATNDWNTSDPAACGPAVPGSGGLNDLWYRFVAPASDNYKFSLCGSGYDTQVSVFSSCPADFDDSSRLTCNDDFCGLQSETVGVSMTAAQTVYVRVAGYNGATGNFTLLVSVAPPPPANENCGGANPALALGVPEFGNNTGTTTDVALSDICGPFVGSGGSNDLFYQFTAPADNIYRFSTCGSAIDTVIAVFGGCPADEFGNFLGCNDDYCGPQSATDISLTTGQLVYVRVSSYTGGPTGDFQVQADVAPPPPTNENCDPAGPEVFLNSPLAGDTSGAATDVFVSLAQCTPFGSGGEADLFYRFTAPADGCYDFSLCGSGFDTHISVFGGCPADEFSNLLACNDDFCGLQSQASGVTLTSGQEVHIRVAGYAGATGTFTLLVTDAVPPPPPPVCADCSGATFTEVEADCGIAGAGDLVNGGCNSPTFAVSSVSLGDVICGSGAFDGALRDTDWYEFSVGADTQVTVDVTAEFDVAVAILDTNCPPNVLSAFVAGFSCTPTSATACLPPGTYRAFIAPQFTGLVGCAGCGASDPANYVASISGVPCVPPAPPADECPGAIVTAPSSTTGTTVGLTGFDITSCTTADSIDGWYTLTAPVTGDYTLSMCGSAYDTALSVWADCPPTIELACNDDFCGLQSQLTVSLTGGETYHIRVSGFNGSAGNFILDISAPPIPTGACCVGGVCSIQTEANCSGDYQGDGTSCDAGGGYTVFSAPFTAIPDFGGGSATDTLAGSGGIISELKVGLNIDHSWQGDLFITLTHVNSGTTVTLVDRPGSDGATVGFGNDNYGNSASLTPFVVDDSAATTYDAPQVVAPGITNVTGGWKSDLGPLSAFNGLDAGSNWTLTVTDNFAADVGTIVQWGLFVNPASVCGPQFCDADWCQDGEVGVPDIFCFLTDWFALDPDARNYGGTPGVPAIFAFLSVWFATGIGPCP